MLRGSACALDGSQTPLRGAGAQPAMGCAYLGVLACSEGGGLEPGCLGVPVVYSGAGNGKGVQY